MNIKYKYIGDGSWVHGVPSKDLTEDEFNALDDELKATMLASGLYLDVSQGSDLEHEVVRKRKSQTNRGDE